MIEGQVVAITGASSGIGKATALELARCGAKLVLGARHEEALVKVAEQVRVTGGKVVYRSTDVSKREDLLSLIRLAQEAFGRLDVLFSNAGAMPIGPFDELAVEDWETMVDVNIKGVLYGISAALPVFREQGSGHFIHTASTAARDRTQPSGLFGYESGSPRPLGWSSAGVGWTHQGEHHSAGLHGHRVQRARQEPGAESPDAKGGREIRHVT